MFYGLSADRVKRVIRYPARVERGIAPKTSAAMQPVETKKKSTEIWVMYQEKIRSKGSKAEGNTQKVIITAWRYPGISPIREEIPIPNDIIAELKKDNLI